MLTRQKSALNRLKLFPTVVTNLYYVEILSTGKYSACRFMLQGNDIPGKQFCLLAVHSVTVKSMIQSQ